MHTFLTSTLSLLLSLPFSTCNPDYSPFFPPSIEQPNINQLLPRQNQCSSDGISCANLGSPNLCCKKSALCAVDQAGHIACCPANSACTGTLGSGAIITSIPTSALVTTAIATGASVVPNGFFPYAYIPTTYANAAICTQSYSSCQREFTSCTATLGNGNSGGGNGVTVNGGGVPGITVQGPVGSVSAASICSSLSLEACHNLQLANCATFPTGTVASTGTFVVPGQGAGGRMRERGMWAVGVGVGVVVVGMVW